MDYLEYVNQEILITWIRYAIEILGNILSEYLRDLQLISRLSFKIEFHNLIPWLNIIIKIQSPTPHLIIFLFYVLYNNVPEFHTRMDGLSYLYVTAPSQKKDVFPQFFVPGVWAYILQRQNLTHLELKLRKRLWLKKIPDFSGYQKLDTAGRTDVSG